MDWPLVSSDTEIAYDIDADNPVGAQTVAADGYTWLEKYLNELAAKAADSPGETTNKQ